MLKQFTLIEHLTELRKRITRIIIIYIALFVYVYTRTDDLIDYLLDYARQVNFVYIKPEELLMSYIKIDLLVALLLALPFISFQCWRFVRPALKKNERLKVFIFFVFTTLLFFGGVYFSVEVITPLTIRFLIEFKHQDISAMLTIENYLTFIINMTLTFGLIFDLPAAVSLLASLNLIHYSSIRKYSKYFILLLMIISALLTPPDVISQLMMFVPLLGLYGVSLFICLLIEKKRARKKHEF